MKCPACGAQHKKRDGTRCRCGYSFVFTDPSARQMSDSRFLAILEKATADGVYFVTPRQLYFEYCRKMRQKGPAKPAVAALVALGGTAALWLTGYESLAVWCGVIVVAATIVCLYRLFSRPMEFPEFQGIIEKYRRAGGRERLHHVLDKPSLQQPPPDWQEPDIYRYGVERVLLVQRDILVDLFVLNGLHAEQRTLVISETGYPEYLRPRVKAILTENPKTPVFFLHDATDRGVGMKKRLRKLNWLPESERRIDLGIKPEDVKKMKRFHAVSPHRIQHKAAIDLLPYSVLAGGLASGLAGQMALAAVMEAQLTSHGDSGFG